MLAVDESSFEDSFSSFYHGLVSPKVPREPFAETPWRCARGWDLCALGHRSTQ